MSPHDRLEETFTTSVDRRLWRKLWSYTRPYRRQVRLVCLFGMLTAAIDVAFPQVTRRVVDEVAASGGDVGDVDLWGYALVYLGLTVAFSACIVTFIRLAGQIRTHVAHDIRSDGFENLQRLSFGYFDHRPVGWLMARMTSDCERLSNILAWGVLDLAWGLTMMTGIAVLMFLMDAQLALVVLLVVPLLAWASAAFKKRILASSRAVRRTNSRITGAYNESIMGVRTTKVFAREDENLAEFQELSGTMYGASVRNALHSALYLPVVLTIGSLATGLALAFGGVDVVGGGLSIGTLIAFLAYTGQFFQPIHDLAHWFAELQMAHASAERIVGLIEEEPEIADSPEVRRRVGGGILPGSGGIRPGAAADGLPDRVDTLAFEGVGFAYAGGERVLDGFDLEVRAGETIALVGSTGGGKSTIAGLLCRFYEPTEGRILVDGVDYTRRGLGWWRSNLGIVLQEPHLFSGTVADNIRYGDLDASDEEVERAARLAGAHDFVAASEDGYATEVGEGGNRLSTGQKQLVSFARAILADPRILVMDEATSSVDTETEQKIQHGLQNVLAGRTSLVIAHRLSTIRSADRILVIAAGRIVEQGSHAELMALRGSYFELYTQQSLREVGGPERIRYGAERAPC